MKTILLLSLAALGVAASAQTSFTYNTMDQVNAYAGHVSTPNFGVNQQFEAGFAAFSGLVADDATSAGGNVNRVAVAMEFSNPATLSTLATSIKGWDIYAASSKATLAGGGGLMQTVANTAVVSVTGAVANARVFEIATNFNVGAGNMFYAVVPIMDFTPNGQTFILSNTGGSPGGNDADGYNPGNGFGLGTGPIALGTNAALAVNVVPEPATMLALGAGLAAFARRRRSSK